MEISEITDGETIKNKKIRPAHVMFALREKLKKAFKDASKIVVEEFDANTESGVNLTDGRDLEFLKEFRVDKAKAGFTAWP